MTTVIPPVRAGTIESRIDIEYEHENLGDGGFRAISVHEWTFDGRAFDEYTDTDEVEVAQRHGHTLRLETEYELLVYPDGTSDCFIDQYAGTGLTRKQDVFWSKAGIVSLDERLQVDGIQSLEQKPEYQQRQKDIPHYKPHPTFMDQVFSTPEDIARYRHMGLVGPSIDAHIHDMLACDSPQGAVTYETFRDRHQREDSASATADD